MDNEHPEERFLSVPAAYFWNNMIELMKFLVAATKQQGLMYKVRLTLFETVKSLPPELRKQLAESPTFIQLAEASGKGEAVARILHE